MFSNSLPGSLAALDNLPREMEPAARYTLQVALMTKMHVEVQSRVVAQLSSSFISLHHLCNTLVQQHQMLAQAVAAEVLRQPQHQHFLHMAAQAAQMAQELQNLGAPLPEMNDMVRSMLPPARLKREPSDSDDDQAKERGEEDADAAAADAPAAAADAPAADP